MVKRFDIYSMNMNKKIKSIVKTMRKYIFKYYKNTFYQFEILDVFQLNSFYYFKYYIKMKVRKITHFSVKCTNEYYY